jgi:hypothetical protein
MATYEPRSPVEQLLVDLSMKTHGLGLDLGSLLIRLCHYSCDDLASIPEDVAKSIQPELQALHTRLGEHARATRQLIVELEAVRNAGRGAMTRPGWAAVEGRDVLPASMWADLLGEFRTAASVDQ